MSDALPIEVFPDPAGVAGRAAELIAAHARSALAARGRFMFAVSGGSTPWAMFAKLAEEDFPWSDTTIFQVDERVAPAGDDARNLTHLRASLPADGVACIQPMPVEEVDLEAAARHYADLLPARFDLIHLGLGPDGHTASLIPGDPVLDVADRAVALTGAYQGHRRMTITYPVIDRARALLWLVSGSDKLQALERLRRHDHSIPAGRVATERALVLADASAAGNR